jgi:hypothetical protein
MVGPEKYREINIGFQGEAPQHGSLILNGMTHHVREPEFFGHISWSVVLG